jgi:hypothetical protein
MNDTLKPNRPSHVLWMVEGEGDNTTWTELGALWAHSKGDGFNLSLKLIPYARDARLVILPRKEKEEAKRGARA